MKPFIKWAGGKTQLLDHILPNIPDFDIYYEPFLGSGSVLLALQPRIAYINDINSNIINCFVHIKNNLSSMINYLYCLDSINTTLKKELYYDIRNSFNEYNSRESLFTILSSNESIYQSAKFIYLNKHCFNGLYRENQKGQFNVPYNGSNMNSYDEENLVSINRYLNNNLIRFYSYDYKGFILDTINVSKRCFVFIDSPYDQIDNNTFTQYTKYGFNKEDHIYLSDICKYLNRHNVKFMLTNHNTELINSLYREFNINVVSVRRSINSNGSNRYGEEVIITNY